MNILPVESLLDDAPLFSVGDAVSGYLLGKRTFSDTVNLMYML